MREQIAKFFEFDRYNATYRREFVAGVTTFITMSYIIAVNPAILKVAGIPEGASMTATIATAIVGSLLMGLIANRPFAIAPYMGENAFVAFTVVRVMGYKWQTALGAVFIAGVVFMLLTLAKVREWMVEAVPPGLSYSFAAGIGLFLTFIGLNESGLVTIGVTGAPLRIGDLAAPAVQIAILSFVLIAALMLWRVPGAILLGILGASVVAFVAGVATPPHAWMSRPPALTPILFALDIRRLTLRFFWCDAIDLRHRTNRHDGLIGRIVGARRVPRPTRPAPSNRAADASRRALNHLCRAGRNYYCGRIHRIGGRSECRRKDRAHRGSSGGDVCAGAVLRSNRHRNSRRGIWPGANNRRLDDDDADRENRFRRSH